MMEMLSSMLSKMLFSAVLLMQTRHSFAFVSVSVFNWIGTRGGMSLIFFCGVGIDGIASFLIRFDSGDPGIENQF